MTCARGTGAIGRALASGRPRACQRASCTRLRTGSASAVSAAERMMSIGWGQPW
jgi:hypothetical protein